MQNQKPFSRYLKVIIYINATDKHTFGIQMPKNDSAENGGDRWIRKKIDVQNVEMPTESFW